MALLHSCLWVEVQLCHTSGYALLVLGHLLLRHLLVVQQRWDIVLLRFDGSVPPLLCRCLHCSCCRCRLSSSSLSPLFPSFSYGLDLFLLSIDEGISGYRDDSLETVKRNEAQYQVGKRAGQK